MPKREMPLVLAISRHRRDHIVRKRGARLICLFRTKIDQDLGENRTIKIKDHNRTNLFKYLSAIQDLDTQDASQKTTTRSSPPFSSLIHHLSRIAANQNWTAARNKMQINNSVGNRIVPHQLLNNLN
jgi:hypothetical protein